MGEVSSAWLYGEHLGAGIVRRLLFLLYKCEQKALLGLLGVSTLTAGALR